MFVCLFDVYVVFSHWKSKQVFDYFTLGVEKVFFLVIVCFPWLQLLDISTEYAFFKVFIDQQVTAIYRFYG